MTKRINNSKEPWQAIILCLKFDLKLDTLLLRYIINMRHTQNGYTGIIEIGEYDVNDCIELVKARNAAAARKRENR